MTPTEQEEQRMLNEETMRAWVCEGTSEEVCRRYARCSEVARDADFGMLDSNIVVVDTEATGLSFEHDELIQIAAARMEQGKIASWFVTYVNPGKPIPEDITRLTGISDEDVQLALTPGEALSQLVDFVGDAIVIAHNVDFDRTFTTAHPEGYPLLDRLWVDTLDLSRVALPRLKSHRLIDLAHAFSAPESTHRANDDVETTCIIYRLLLAAITLMPKPLVVQIASLATADEWPTGEVFRYFAGAGESGKSELANASVDTVGAGEAFEVADGSQPSADENDQGEFDEKARKPVLSMKELRRGVLGKGQNLQARVDADVLASDPLKGLSFPSEETIEEAFGPDGLVSRLYDSYEPRVEQTRMAKAVASAFERSRNLIVEAGTGVGKSMAYLVPAALMAKENKITVGIATKTKTLLDQLVYKELPRLSEELDGLTFSSLKGFGHYVCLRKVERLIAEGSHVRTVAGKGISQAPSLAALLSFIEQARYDDIDTLKLDYRAVPRWSFTTVSADCMRRKCPFFGTACFVHGARRAAAASDIVVTNHALLFCDVVTEGGLLPPIRHWIVDEAHGSESEARRAFSRTLAAEELLGLASKIGSVEASRNAFLRLTRKISAGEMKESHVLLIGLAEKAAHQGEECSEAIGEFVAHMKDLLFFDPNKKSKGYEYVDLWLNDDIRASATFQALASYGATATERAEKLTSTCQELVGLLDDVGIAAEEQREIASTAMRLLEMTGAMKVILDSGCEEYAYSATLNRKKDRVTEKLEALLLHVGPKLDDLLYRRSHSVVYTSATLAIDKEFDVFERAVGLNEGEFTEADSLLLESSYDFDENMTIYVIKDIPEPGETGYLEKLQELLVEAHRAQQGSMLTLFTNRREMEACYEAARPLLKEDGLRVLCQKWGLSTKSLRDDFLSDEHLSLFALKSFWEGFDAPGATLKGIIIPKLPFARPTDPLSCERAERDSAAWRHYTLPAAVVETKQAVGRLIRSSSDRGVVIFADKRLVTKGYGRTILGSMPSRNIVVCTCKEAVEAIRRERA